MGAVALWRLLSRSLLPATPLRWKGRDLVLPLVALTVTLLALNFDLEYIGFLFRL